MAMLVLGRVNSKKFLALLFAPQTITSLKNDAWAQTFVSKRGSERYMEKSIQAMSFLHELTQTMVQAQRDAAERKRLYDLETERLVQAFVATQKESFMEECRKAARNQKNICCINVFLMYLSNEVHKRDVGKGVLEKKLRAMLLELGFHDGGVRDFGSWFQVSATWPVADAARSTEPCPERASGTSITCPICQEHRPAVVLMPCGHVVCRNCQRRQQFRKCPMCRGPVSSASNGLFMD